MAVYKAIIEQLHTTATLSDVINKLNEVIEVVNHMLLADEPDTTEYE